MITAVILVLAWAVVWAVTGNDKESHKKLDEGDEL